MTAKRKGDGLLLVFSDVAPEHDEEYNRWYNEEHIPERLSIPGVLDAARYEAVQGGPRYLGMLRARFSRGLVLRGMAEVA